MDSYLYRVLLVPSAVFLSVLFGPSYSSGAAVTQFITVNGPKGGLVSILTIAAVFAVTLSLSFELARKFKSYEYVGFIRHLLKRFWFLYEIVILLGIVAGLSIAITIGGAILEDRFGLMAWVGSLAIFLIIVLLTFYGRNVVKKSMILSMAALFLVLGIFVFQLYSDHLVQIAHVFANSEIQASGIVSGLRYAVVSAGFVPLLLYCAVGLRTRGEAFVAGIVAAVIAVLPEIVFHFAFLVDYPDVIQHPIPIYRMFELVSTPFMLNVYALLMFLLVAQTGVGLQQGLIERCNAWQKNRNGVSMTRKQHAAVATATAIISVGLSSMGVVALILRAYAILFFGFIAVFMAPLLTYGVYLVFQSRVQPASLEDGVDV